ncbi:hypothetical protein MTBGP_05250 [Moorella thermoacetica]|uniref:type I-B CRISPR-associated protein Cas5b n=1 Tax=Neomoorella thermoacetica TaxID=1525 RepID=UPI0030D5831A
MVLVFDVAADLAMFRKSYTTTSQVSYAFPPPTAVAGLLAAIAGIDHGAGEGCKNAAFWQALAGCRVAVGLKNPLRWVSTTVNLIKYKTPNGSMGEHIQSKHQLVKNPRYRIYVSGGEIYAEVKKRLERNEFIFTPFLGVAYALADITYVGEYRESIINDKETWVDTIVPLYRGVQPDIQRCRGIHRELVPFRMDNKRELLKTVTVIYPEIKTASAEATGKDAGWDCRLWLKDKGELEVFQVAGERVCWFECW